jgi:hypothetical protein
MAGHDTPRSQLPAPSSLLPQLLVAAATYLHFVPVQLFRFPISPVLSLFVAIPPSACGMQSIFHWARLKLTNLQT